MDILTRNRYLGALVVLLLLLNTVLIGWMFFESKNMPKQHGRKQTEELQLFLDTKLQLTRQQSNNMKALREEFFVSERVLSSQIRTYRDSMNLIMFMPHPDSLSLVRLASNVAGGEFQMELLRIKQAERFRQMLTPQQQTMLQMLVNDIRDYFKPIKKN